MTQPILITGAGGWLGRRLVEALAGELDDPLLTPVGAEASASLRTLVAPGEDATALSAISRRVDIVRGDLRNPTDMRAFCKGAEGALLFHIAGLIHPALFVRDLRRVNVDGSAHLLDSAMNVGIRRAIVMSSNSPLGTNPDREQRFDEASPYRPYMGYGRSKHELELLVAERRECTGLEAVLIRAPWFYGPCQPARQSEFFRMIRQGRAPIVGDGGNLRSMAYVDNLCQGLLLAARNPEAAGETYWIADRRPYAMAEIVDTIERVMQDDFGMQVDGGRLHLPGLVSEIAMAVDWTLQTCGLYQQKIHVLSEMNKNIACRIDKAERYLGYAPRIELEEGMRRSIQWLLDQGTVI